MATLEDMKEINANLNHIFWHDDGGCGCTTRKRRRYTLAWAVLFTVFGIIGLASGNSEGAYLFVVAIVLFAASMLCPNGCCGEYSRSKDRGMINSSEFKDEVCCCLVSASATSSDGLSSPLMDPADSWDDLENGNLDADALLNVRTLKRYFHVYNSGLEAEMLDFVNTRYSDNYTSTVSSDKTYTKADLSGIFKEAWRKKRQIVCPMVLAVSAAQAEYAYTLKFQGDHKPMKLKATASFSPPGTFERVTFSST